MGWAGWAKPAPPASRPLLSRRLTGRPLLYRRTIYTIVTCPSWTCRMHICFIRLLLRRRIPPPAEEAFENMSIFQIPLLGRKSQLQSTKHV